MTGTGGHTPGGDEPHGKTPATRMGGAPSVGNPGDMFNDLLEMTAVEVRDRLLELQAERAYARDAGMTKIDAYMADLETELEMTRQLYVASAVTEIATLQAELFGANNG
jgi:hypothetical protein